MISEEVCLSKRMDGIILKTTKSLHLETKRDFYKTEVLMNDYSNWWSIKEYDGLINAVIGHKKYDQMDREELGKIINAIYKESN